VRGRILVGDCRVRMAELEANSIDAIVTDPPYGLAFMGKAWDHGVPGEEFWREAYRVAKPGAHLLAFGGSRTFHRLTVAIEDAGWEIRDCLSWLYGSGFPKSMDVSKAIDRGFRKGEDSEEFKWSPSNGPTADIYAVTAFVKAARVKAGKGNRDIDALFGFNGMAGHWTSSTSQPSVPTWPQWERLKEFLGMGPEMDDLVVTINGGKGDRSIENTALAEREIVGQHEKAAAGQTWNANYGLPADVTPKEIMGGAATKAAKRWEGWGTALKPGWEPIVLARKKLLGGVAANVLAYGTGAVNVDGCRIEGVKPVVTPIDSDRRNNPILHTRSASGTGETTTVGRWPANVLLDESAAEMLDEQSGESGPSFIGKPCTSDGMRSGFAGGLDGPSGARGHDDSGGASRFFYTAKASSSERHEGTERNSHPTVKPVALMRWLCRLVTPRGGVVLDPFCGSGSTGVAAISEGFDFVGIELSEEYAAIASARCGNVAPMFAEVEKVDEKSEEEKQMGLGL